MYSNNVKISTMRVLKEVPNSISIICEFVKIKNLSLTLDLLNQKLAVAQKSVLISPLGGSD